MKKLIWLAVLSVALAGCRKDKEAEPGVASAVDPGSPVSPPTAPICSTRLYSSNGGIGGVPIPSRMIVNIPGFDENKGDRADFTYKRWDATGWANFRAGFYSPVTFAIQGANVTITNLTADQYDWAFAATIKDCR